LGVKKAETSARRRAIFCSITNPQIESVIPSLIQPGSGHWH
jgi:hypothetical protein